MGKCRAPADASTSTDLLMKIYGKKQTNSNWISAEDIHQKATGKILPHPCLDRSSNQKRSALIPSLVFLKESNVSKARVTQLLLSIRHKVISSDSTKPEPQSFPTQPKPIWIYTETQAKRKKKSQEKTNLSGSFKTITAAKHRKLQGDK